MTVTTSDAVRLDYAFLPVCKDKIYIKPDKDITRVLITASKKYAHDVITKCVT